MRIIVLHDRFSNEPIVVKTSAINAVRKVIDRMEKNVEEYSEILVGPNFFGVKENIGAVMIKIQKAESGDKE